MRKHILGPSIKSSSIPVLSSMTFLSHTLKDEFLPGEVMLVFLFFEEEEDEEDE